MFWPHFFARQLFLHFYPTDVKCKYICFNLISKLQLLSYTETSQCACFDRVLEWRIIFNIIRMKSCFFICGAVQCALYRMSSEVFGDCIWPPQGIVSSPGLPHPNLSSQFFTTCWHVFTQWRPHPILSTLNYIHKYFHTITVEQRLFVYVAHLKQAEVMSFSP